jgi:phage-related protein
MRLNMPSNLPIITFRLSENDNLKFKYISKENNRKINDELKMLVQNHIKEFEAEHGEIIVGEDGNVTTSKPKSKGASSNLKSG